MSATATTNFTIATLLDLTAASAHAAPAVDDGSSFDALLQAPPQPEDRTGSPPNAEQQKATSAQRDDRRSESDKTTGSSASESEAPAPAASSAEQATDTDKEPEDEVALASDDALAAAETIIEQSLAAISPPPAAVADALSAASEGPQDKNDASESEIAATAAKSRREKTVSPTVAVSYHSTTVAAATGAAVVTESTANESKQISGDAPRADFEIVQSPDQEPQRAGQGSSAANLARSTEALSPEILPGADAPAAESPAGQKESASADAALEQTVGSDSARPSALQPMVNDHTTPPTAPLVTPLAAPAGASPQQPAAASRADSTSVVASGSGGNRTRLPGQLLAQAEGPAARRSAGEVDAPRLLSRVARAFAAAQERDGEVRLRLSPPELGSLRLEVRVQDGVLVAHMETETEAARTAIVENLPALRERLAEQGVRIERFDVDLMQRQPPGTPDQSNGRQQDDPAPAQRPAIAGRRATENSTQAATRPYITTSADGLNVIV